MAERLCERALGNEEKAAIETHGLFDLKSFLPKKPGEVELRIIKEMFEASVDGEAYDPDRWSAYFKPAGFGGSGSATGSGTPAAKAATPSTPVDEDDVPFKEAAPAPAEKVAEAAPAASTGGSEASARAQDILAMIRNRQKAE